MIKVSQRPLGELFYKSEWMSSNRSYSYPPARRCGSATLSVSSKASFRHFRSNLSKRATSHTIVRKTKGIGSVLAVMLGLVYSLVVARWAPLFNGIFGFSPPPSLGGGEWH